MTQLQLERVTSFLFGAGAVIVMLGAITAIVGWSHRPVAGLLMAFMILTGLFAVAGAAFGLIAGMTTNDRRAKPLR